MQRSTAEVPLTVSQGRPQPLAVQVAAQLRDAMTDGRLAAGERLPATRALAVSLGVSRTVITSAYAQLFAEGWIEGRHGSGTFVAEGAPGCAGPAPPGSAAAAGQPRLASQAGAAPAWPASRRGEGKAGPGGAGPARAGAAATVGPGGVSATRIGTAGAAGVAEAGPVAGAAGAAGARASGTAGASGIGGANGTFGIIRATRTVGASGEAARTAGVIGTLGVIRTVGAAGTARATGTSGGLAAAGDLINLEPGIPWAAGIDQAAWRRAWRQAGHQLPTGLTPVPGLAGLRQALTGYLRRSRGVRCTADQILITRGVAGSLTLLAAGLLQPGDLVGVEEPGYQAAREVFAARGARVVPCAVDRDGLVVSELPAGLRMVYTTPAHQYPLGGRLPVPRRQALVAWARATGALIVEDDYDGEFRYDVAPLPALFGLDPEVVVYLGTASKTLTPGLSTGWLVAQPGLTARLAETSLVRGERAAEAAQRAVLTLIAGGDLERHIRRMRHEYARRRRAVVGLLGEVAPGRLLGDTAGMHIVLELPPGRARRVAAAARERGVSVVTLDRYYAGPAIRGGLVLGYGGASLGEVTAGCRILAEILRDAG